MNNPAPTPISIMALTPPFIPLQTLPITHPTAHVGLSIFNYYKDPLGLVVLFGPWQGQEVYEVVDLLLNGAPTPVASEIVMDDSKAVVLRLPLGLLTDGPNTLKCAVKRQSGNEDSVDLIVLYSVNAPAGEDFDTGAGHSRLSIDVTPKSIGPGEAAHGVTLEMNYPHKRLYDTLTVDCGGQTIKHQIVPTMQDPNPETKSVVLTLFAAEFAKDPNNPQFPIRYSVVSQEGNFSGTSPVGQFIPHDHWSQLCLIDVHLDRVELQIPILQEILGDNNDDPATIDLAKLNGGPLWALIHLIASVWQPADQIHMTFTAVDGNGIVVATYEVTLPVMQVPGQLAVDIPNSKVVADSAVRVSYEQIRGGKVIGLSKDAEAQVIGKKEAELEIIKVIPIGDGPVALAGNNSGSRVFVSNARSKTVMAIDAHAMKVIASTPMSVPAGLVVSHDDRSLYVCAPLDGKLVVFDSSSLTPLKHIDVGSNPHGVARGENGRYAYVSCLASGQLEKIDTTMQTVVQRVSVVGLTYFIAVSQDGAHIYASITASDTVSVFDALTLTLITNIPINSPCRIAFSPDGLQAFVGSQASDAKMSVIDTKQFKVINSIPVGQVVSDIAVSPDGKYLYTCIVRDHMVRVIDIMSMTVLQSVPVNSPHGIWVTPSGQFVFVCDGGNNTVTVMGYR